MTDPARTSSTTNLEASTPNTDESSALKLDRNSLIAAAASSPDDNDAKSMLSAVSNTTDEPGWQTAVAEHVFVAPGSVSVQDEESAAVAPSWSTHVTVRVCVLSAAPQAVGQSGKSAAFQL